VKGKLRFEPSARLQYILAEELVSDPNVAVLEFVKNAYDADATSVDIWFDLGESPGASRLIVADDGSGMTKREFERNWMHPGYSAKVNAGTTSRNRVPVGEKGLGRLAAGRLGKTLDVYSRTRPTSKWLHAHFRWTDFNNMNRNLRDVEVPWDDESEPPVEELGGGTVIEINGLKMKWDARVPGRRAKGRATTRLGRLRQDLEVLLLPITAGGHEFEISLEHDSELPEDESGLVEPPIMEFLDYRFDFRLEQDSRGWKIKRTVERSQELADRAESQRRTTETTREDELPLDVNLEECGAFRGSFYYAPRSAPRLRALGAPTGVRIYRDDVRIDPYGDPEDDWLGASARKAVRQGHAAIQPNALYGAVQISKEENPSLNPLANREGLIENDALDAFLTVCRNEFARFGQLIREEYIEPRWEEQQADKKRKAALDSTQWAMSITRSAAHAVRQPITSADNELASLQRTIRKATGIPADVERRLQQLHDRTKDQLSRIDDAVTKMLDWLDVSPEPRRLDLAQLIDEVLENTEGDATSANIELRSELERPMVMEIPVGLLEHALEELIENAIQARRPAGRNGFVLVRSTMKDGQARIGVEDNAGGIPDDVKGKLFEETVSRAGRIGVGLLWNRQLLRVAGGDLSLQSTGSDGSIFEIAMPGGGN
jgi:signal transduction histidine kinase